MVGLCAWLLRHRAPRVASLCIGIAMVFGMITAAELVLRVAGVGRPAVDTAYPESYYGVNKYGLVGPLPGSHRVVETSLRDNTVIYDVVHTVDEKRRRVVPDDGGPYSRYAVFVGDSYTYGVGVRDEETLPAAFARLQPDAHTYNYGFQGSGPFDILAGLETTDFAGEVAETAGTVIYTFIDEHVLRTRDFILGASYRGKRVVYETDADGNLVRCGTWNTCHPWRHKFVRFIAGSRIRALTGFEMPLTPEDFERTARTIARMDAVARERLRGSQLLMVFYPGCRLASGLIPLLEARGIRYLDLSQSFEGISPPNILSIYDRHPNAGAYERVASSISSEYANHLATP